MKRETCPFSTLLTQIMTTPNGMEHINIRNAITFLIISNLRYKSERPLTCNRFKLSFEICSVIKAKQNICKNNVASSHFSVRRTKIKGLATAANNIKKKIIGIDVTRIYFLYTDTNRSSSFCIFANIGNVTLPMVSMIAVLGK